MAVEAGASIQGPDAIAAAAGPACRRIRGQVLGLIGLGRIGIATALRAKAFGFKIVFFDPQVKDGMDKAIGGIERADSLADLLARSDCVSMHANATADNEKMINKSTLGMMKRGSFFVNTARGELVDEEDLAEALTSGHLAGAALDVHWGEPFLKGQGPLGEVPNLLCTPHNAWFSVESRTEMRVLATEAIKRVMDGQPVRNCVNKAHLVQPHRAPVGDD